MNKFFGKLIKGLFSQLTFVCIILLIQAGIFIYLTSSIYSVEIRLALYVVSAFVVVYIVNGTYSPSYKLSWVIPILIFPVFGGLLFILLKLQRPRKKSIERINRIAEESAEALKQDENVESRLSIESEHFASSVRYMNSCAGCSVVKNTAVTYFPSGEELWPVLLTELRKAKKYIFIEFFIIREGEFWNSVLDVLTEKAASGVDVRVLYDGVGSISTLPHNYYKKLEKLGIKARVFNPFVPLLTVSQNNRNHRKIVSVDGRVAFNGGINLADEYVNREDRFGYWKDTSVMLKGDAAYNFTVMFLQMWQFTDKNKNTAIDYLSYKPKRVNVELTKRAGYVLPYCDHPIDNENVGEFVYLDIINNATDYLYITTPYLIIDDTMYRALHNASKRGVDVKIIIPKNPDHWYAYYVTETYSIDLIKAGIEIYKYTPGFIHAKSVVSDNDMAIVGSINFDYRSLYLHYECATLMYKDESVAEVYKDFNSTLLECEKMTVEKLKKVNIFKRILRVFLKLFAPLM